MERCIDRLRSFHFLLKLLSSISMKKSLHLSTFSFTFYLSASSRSIQPRHINIISTSFYFIFHYSSRFISYAFFHHLYQAFTSSNSLHYTTFLYILFFLTFHSIFFLNFITQSGSHFFIHNNIISITFLYISSSFFTIYSINPYSFEPIQKLMFI